MDTKKHSKQQGFFRPFEDLKTLIEKKSLKVEPSPVEKSRKSQPQKAPKPTGLSKASHPDAAQTSRGDDTELFMEAMADVQPLQRDDRIENDPAPLPRQTHEPDGDAEIVQQLKNLINYGEGFVVADTPEYIEGTGFNVSPDFTQRLHRGEFSIQAHVDLHGLNVEDARHAFDAFFKDAITTGKRGVLIVHGRGLSSPAEPVLKTKVVEWLTSGHWRKWVIAFTSARSCDGGAGATYVLIRQRPLTKSKRKKKIN
jgi:DNA-nicking Smr family endonuclease